MDGCVLRVAADEFDPDAFLVGSRLSPSAVWHKGEKRFKTQLISKTSGFNVIVSNANDLPSQVQDAIRFLTNQRPELLRLRRAHAVDHVLLDFGIARKNSVAQFNSFPAKLLALAVEFGTEIELSLYDTSPELVAEPAAVTSPRSIHDNIVYAYKVLCEQQEIILHTEYRDGAAEEYTDVIFLGVVAHHFELVLPGNILFGIEEVDPEWVVREWADLFARNKKYGWPAIEYGEPQELVSILKHRDIRGYEVGSCYGLSGWVLATQFNLQRRVARFAP